MKTAIGILSAATFLSAATDAEAQGYSFGFSTGAAAYGGSGYYGAFPGYYTRHGAPAYHLPVYSAPAHPGFYAGYAGVGYRPGWNYPGPYGVYHTSYYTFAPGYSFTYYRGPVPRYYPGQYGAIGAYGNYGYGAYGW